MDTVRKELERLLREADSVDPNEETQRVWAAQVRRLLDVFLGPTATNIHHPGFNEFNFALSHAEKTALLRTILLSAPLTSTSDEATRARSSLKPMLFASYAREDYAVVRPVLDAVRHSGVDVWLDVDTLKPGQQFSDQIADALDSATGLLLFLSSASARSRLVHQELQAFSSAHRLVIPILLEESVDLPPDLRMLLSGIQTIHITGADAVGVERAAQAISQAVAHAKRAEPQAASGRALNRELADTLAGDARKQPSGTSEIAAPPRSVFVVHGHNDSFLAEVESYLKELGVESVVLRRIGGAAQSLFQKFMQWGKETRFAIVLLSSDDVGASRSQYETDGVAERSLQFRARQNVILELGFFYGHLGWENVFVLYRSPPKVFPNFERPSDLDGVVFDHVDESGRWKEYLRAKLQESGFSIAGKPNNGMQPTREDARG